MTKRDVVVASTRHHRARLLKYYPRPPCAPSFVKWRIFRPLQTHFLLFQQIFFDGWAHVMKPTQANSWALTCCPSLHLISTVTMVWRYEKQHLRISRKQNKKSEKFSRQMASKLTIEANKKTINFLDITLGLTSRSYKPFMKPNNKSSTVHRQSNHPPALLKSIPENINKRLTSISSRQKVLDDAIPPYLKTLDDSGYNHKLTF